MRYGLESETKAIQKYESVSKVKVHSSGLWVNPRFPFLGCSPDGLVNDDTQSFTSSCGKESPEQELTVFPWGRTSSTGIKLNNTCPLDNWLMIFQALVKSGKVNLADLTESGHIIGSALRLVDDGQLADAKLLIVQSLQWQHQGVY